MDDSRDEPGTDATGRRNRLLRAFAPPEREKKFTKNGLMIAVMAIVMVCFLLVLAVLAFA